VVREVVTEPNLAWAATYEEACEVCRSLYPATKVTMHHLTDLANRCKRGLQRPER
jgi:hypothetical protein